MSKDLIGVLTWGRNLNYGGALQALALRTAIEKMGRRAELVHYEQNQSDLLSGRDVSSNEALSIRREPNRSRNGII